MYEVHQTVYITLFFSLCVFGVIFDVEGGYAFLRPLCTTKKGDTKEAGRKKRTMSGYLAYFLALVVLLATCASSEKFYVVQQAPGQLRVLRQPANGHVDFTTQDVIIVGEYNNTMKSIGWDVMSLTTNSKFADEDQAYAAGFFEGQVSYRQAYNHYNNHFTTEPNPKVLDFFEKNVQWMEKNIALLNRTDPMWYHVGLLYRQWRGLLDGLNSEEAFFTVPKLMALTSMGDMFDIGAIYNADSERRKDWRKMPKAEFENWFARITHCSALYKIAGDFSDVYFGHTSWYTYTHMLRIYKHVTLNYNNPNAKQKTISYSSYPGMLSSFDDFYVTDTLSVIETSISILNTSLYNGNIKPESLMYWVRVMAANRMASTAPQWTQIFARYNSGTYNNQWMVFDLTKFTPGKPLPPNTMWVSEQLPGIVLSRDVTEVISYGYYPSYNVPMIPEIFEKSGYAEAVRIHGTDMDDYQMCVRAQMFRRDQGKVTDMSSFQHLLQYNNYEEDPISQGNPLYAIACRGDLDLSRPRCFGAYDSKTASWRSWKDGHTTFAFSGPTPQQPHFSFNSTRAACGHHDGLPDTYSFGWKKMQP